MVTRIDRAREGCEFNAGYPLAHVRSRFPGLRYCAPELLGGAMMEGGAAIPPESLATDAEPVPDPESGRQRRVAPMPSGIVPGGQGRAAAAPVPVVALPVAAGAVVPVPVLAVGSVVPGPVVGAPTAPALLPVRPEAPTPAPVPPAPAEPGLELPPVPPPIWARALPDRPRRKAAARAEVFEGFMGGSQF